MLDEDSATNRSGSIRELLFSLELLGVLCCTETEWTVGYSVSGRASLK